MKRQSRPFRITVSIVFGLLGFAINFLDIKLFQHPAFTVSILAGLFFPLFISMAWGWRYGLLSALAGGCQSMWWLWRNDGWGILYSVPVFTLWIIWHGWWSEKRIRLEPHPVRHSMFMVEIPIRIAIEFGFFTIFRQLVSFNPPPWNTTIIWRHVPISWVIAVSAKHTITAYILLLFTYILLSSNTIRKSMGLTERPTYRDSGIFIANAVAMGLIFWSIQSVISFYLFNIHNQTFWEIAVTQPEPHDITARTLFIVLTIIGAVAGLRIVKRRNLLQNRLDRSNTILSGLKKINTLSSREHDPDRLLRKTCGILVDEHIFRNVCIFTITPLKAGAATTPHIKSRYIAGFDSSDSQTFRTIPYDCIHTMLQADEIKLLCLDSNRPPQCLLRKIPPAHTLLVKKLHYNGVMYGWMSVTEHVLFAQDSEIHALISELVDDLSYAVHTLETESYQKHLEHQLATMIQAIDQGMIAVDPYGTITAWNTGAEALFGYSSEEIVGKSITILSPPETQEEQSGIYQEFIHNQNPFTFETEQMTKSGRIIPVEISLSVKYDDTNKPEGAVGIIRDITERKAYEEALALSEARARSILDSSPMLIVLLDRNGIILDCNSTFAAFYDRERIPLIDTPIWPLFVPSTIEKRRSQLESVFATGEPKIRETSFIEGIWTEYTLYPVKSTDGTTESVVTLISDITEHIEMEEHLELAQQTIDNSTVNIFWISPDGSVVNANRAACKTLGYNRQELIGKTICEIDPNYVSGNRQTEWRQLREKKLISFDTQHTTKDGATIPVNIIKCYQEYHGNEYEIAYVRDITDEKNMREEREKLEKQIQQSMKMESIGRLASGVAHDFNNLLGPILGYGEMLMEDFDTQDSRREMVDGIVQSGERAKNLVRQLLTFSRKQNVNFQCVDLNAIILNFQKLLRKTVREDIDINMKLAETLPTVQADIGQVEQVLMNLVVNAQDAMPGSGTILIETDIIDIDEHYIKMHSGTQSGRHVTIAVSDTGCGMDKDTQNKIFEPFFSTKRAGEGTGLGLSTVFGIIKKHNGMINVYSEPGKGTSFKIHLPALTDKNSMATAPHGTTIEGSLTGTERILIAEDDIALRLMAFQILSRRGYVAVCAKDTKDAISIMRERNGAFDLLLSDVIMPEMNGKELAEKITTEYPHIKTLFMSGYSENIISHHGILEKELDFIHKPFTINELLGKVRHVLDS